MSGLARHALDHVLCQHAARAQTQKNIRAADDFAERTCGRGLREPRLLRIHQFSPSFVDDAGEIGQPDVLARQPQIQQQVHACQRRRTGSAHHHLHLADRLADDLQPVDACRAHDDGGAVLIVVEHRDLHAPAQFAFDDEAFRRLDILQVDGAESRLQRGNDLNQLLRIALFNLDVEDIDAREFLEQNRLAFHHGLGRQRTNGSEPEHRGAVADHADQIAARREAKHVQRILDNRLACGRNPRRIGERQIALVQQLFGGGDRYLSRNRELVVVERLLSARLFDFVSLHK